MAYVPGGCGFLRQKRGRTTAGRGFCDRIPLSPTRVDKMLDWEAPTGRRYSIVAKSKLESSVAAEAISLASNAVIL